MKIVFSKKKLNEMLFIFFIISYFFVGTTVNIPGVELFRWIGSAVLLIFGLKDHLDYSKSFRIWPWQFWLVFLAVVLSLVANTNIFFGGMFKFISNILLFTGLYMFFDRKSIYSEDLKKMFTIFCWSVSIIIFWQIILLILSPNEFGVFKGIFGNKNYLVSVSSVGILCAIWIMLQHKKFGTLFFLASLIITFATGSRTGIVLSFLIIGAIPIIFTTGMTPKNILKFIILFVFVAIILYYIIVYANIPAIDRLFATQSINGSTGLSRNGIWDKALPLIEQNPLLGHGFSSIYYGIKSGMGRELGFHNSYLTLLTEVGIIGFSLISVMFMVTFKKIYLAYKYTAEKNKYLFKILLFICIILLINAFSESFLFAVGNSVSMYFWLSLFLLIAFSRKRGE